MLIGGHRRRTIRTPDPDDGELVFSGEEDGEKLKIRKFKGLYFAVIPNLHGMLVTTEPKATFHKAEDLARIFIVLPFPAS